ncbi:MAG TPA: alternative ribosome rescue aminoacyl-tRNA hydrolase ArfB [Candidatus Polarisedimenticolaceae bacterium]|nr:alternative ribosome rescue aminoacyl-tRNA hydrolase ArfB [Candidatus Polarisedimenticolaceae bacterium]
MVPIDASLAIPENELRITAERSSGPGGQHVNKVSTRIVLEFDLAASSALDPERKERIRRRLGRRITRDGRLRIVCQRHRSQAANRREAIERFAELIRRALAPRRRRVATGVPPAERRRRLEQKRQRARLKDARRDGGEPDG